ncbi:MAG TPA: sugar ABC transporter ATP-binding protein [Baekduia sp.]|uniref:sugar ABC transporter ATP-binding protein n=1 Tax=Baekduia sp. TaxID=2600305 RepID=UPI002B8677A6|nr:sugar ABC transporter ATP-binding protein [Baekduia sp.]HMJ36303.1 sugar ABC transporter ATP-binding protein [Baekduia sp.]
MSEARTEPEGATDAAATASLALRGRAIHKSFPGVRALHDVDFDLRAGEVHGLVGENGAGKSTFVKIIMGAHAPDLGVVEAFGHEVRHGDPRARRRAGIAAIYQELTIVPEMSAAANVFLGRPQRRGPFVSRSETRRAFRQLTARLGLAIDPDVRAASLSVAHQQMLEIMRALAADHRILIMDEPTASLGPAERAHLYETIRGLREEGVSTVYVSHQLDEVLALCDRVSVMRDGEIVATEPVERWTKDGLVTAMLGHVLLKPPRQPRTIAEQEVLRVEGLSVPGVLDEISFTLRRGEILGLGGLVGAGRTELLRALAGADAGARGRLFVRGRERPWPRTVRSALALGIALAPEERKSQGLVLSLSAAANVSLTDMRSVASGPVLRGRRRLRRAAEIMRPFAFDARRLREPAGSFSGGNQQKLVVAKWLHRRPDVLLMDEFTRGIDVGAKEEMLALVRRLAAEGMSIIIVSSELEELVECADRVLVLARGRLIGELGHADASVERILRLAFEVEERAENGLAT